MTLQGRPRRLAALTIAALAAACALAPSAGARASRAADGDLSPRLAELAKPSVRSAPPAKQAAILDVAPSGPGSLLRDGNRVLVDVRFDRGAVASVDALRAAGAEVVHVSSRYQTITAAVLPASLPDIAKVARVEGVAENLTPIVSAAGNSGPVASTVTPCFGAATSEGDTQLNAMAARDGFGVDGSGVTVGILSDSFDTDPFAVTDANGDVASGDLPGSPDNPCGNASSVNVLDDYTPSNANDPDPTDEGRAMAQIVHDLSPGASIAFATAFKGDLSFADNIRALASAGAQVIVDDVVYLDEPFFQDGPVSVAVNDVTASGVSYFSSAGNNNLIDDRGRDIASWEAPAFRDSGGCPAALAPDFPWADHCMDFNPAGGVDNDFSIAVQSGTTLIVDLQWAQPWDGVTTDLDAYLLLGSTVVAAEQTPNLSPASQQPLEILGWENTTGSTQSVNLVVNRCDTVCDAALGGDTGTPPLKFALLENGSGVTGTEYPQSSGGDVVGPTIFGHNGAANAMSVGAIRFNTTSAPERFSSRGPVKHYFGPVARPVPAPPLPGSPQTIPKPDLVATNGGANTFFGSCVSDVWRFFGTSASAPHAAAIAALELDARPLASVSEVKQAQLSTADAVGAFGATAVGAGLLNANDAVGQILGVGPGSGSSESPGFAPPSCTQSPPSPTPAPTPTPTPVPLAGSDVTPPETFLGKRPRRLVLTRKNSILLAFGFQASEDGSTFVCRIDRGKFHRCSKNLVRWFQVGRHAIRVKAVDAAGNVDPTPAVYRFRVDHRS